ncbi:MAG: anaerobic sulfatase maturase [Firmicutes bacterium]|nr:anaerobic sulfatase maturase [Bacillota bacterium]
MRCKYCFYADVVSKREIKSYGIMNEETLEKLTRKALDYADGFCSFGFQGGEPTLAGLDFYKKLIEFQKLHNHKNVTIYNSIQTNGYGLDEEFVRFLGENKFLVGVSLDGSRAIHNKLRVDANGEGTYEKIIETTALLDKHRVDYNILCVVSRDVAQNPVAVYNSLKRFKFLQFIPCIDGFNEPPSEFSLTAKDYGHFLKETFSLYYKDFKNDNYISVRNFDNYISILMGRSPENCAMNGRCSCYFLIEGDGSTFPCDFYVLDEWKLGNVNTDSFQRMINSQKANEFVQTSQYVAPKCQKCKWYSLCRGGCRRDREPFADGKLSLNKYCEGYIYFFENTYQRMLSIVKQIEKTKK